MKYTRHTKESLQEAASKSFSIRETMVNLGLAPTGGNNTHISRKIREFGIDTSHFTGQLWNKGRTDLPKKPTSELLVLRDEFDPITNGLQLKKALMRNGRLEVCEKCGLGTIWNNAPIVLHVDHKNGKRWDNREENLRFLCPNCHSQTETYAGRGIKH